MKPEIKIVYFDIDWTLYDHKNRRWSLPAITAIRSLKQKGIRVVICTARPYHSLRSFGALDLGVDWDGYITSAGGVCFAEENIIQQSLMKKEDVLAFVAAVKSHHLSMELVEPRERKLVFPQTYSSRVFYATYREVIPPRGIYEGEDVTGINFFAAKRWDKEFSSVFPQLVYSRYFDYAVDVMPRQHQKGEGIDALNHYFGCRKEETLGFGDDLQDISIAEHVGQFVCMGNGREELKKVASFVTQPVWDDGVVEGLRHYGLID